MEKYTKLEVIEMAQEVDKLPENLPYLKAYKLGRYMRIIEIIFLDQEHNNDPAMTKFRLGLQKEVARLNDAGLASMSFWRHGSATKTGIFYTLLAGAAFAAPVLTAIIFGGSYLLHRVMNPKMLRKCEEAVELGMQGKSLLEK